MSVASDLERQMLDLINAERAARGLNPVQLELRLNEAAEDHSEWMLDVDRFSHTGVGGSSPTERMQDAGFVLSGSWRTAENIAWQSIRGAPGLSDDVENLHDALMNSPGHRANILNADVTVIGIGIETGNFDGWNAVMVTQNFARTSAPLQLDTGGGSGGGSGGGAPVAAAPIVDDGPSSPVPVYVKSKGIGDSGDNYMILRKKGKLDGGDGDDHLVGSRSKDKLLGGTGDDLLQGEGRSDKLFGHDGNDTLEGGGGKDKLNGGAGFDTLTGGGGADTFYFSEGTDHVTDFGGADKVFLRKTASITKYSDLVNNHMSQSGSDVVIDDGSGNSMVLLDTSLSDLDKGDFIF